MVKSVRKLADHYDRITLNLLLYSQSSVSFQRWSIVPKFCRPAEGKFLVYAQNAGHKTAMLPEKTVELTRTVANYEKYLRELRKQLYESYYRRTLDTKTASRLTQDAFGRFRLPDVE